jgi:hypothetical protein
LWSVAAVVFVLAGAGAGVLWWTWPKSGNAPLPSAAKARPLSAAQIKAFKPAVLPPPAKTGSRVRPLPANEVDIPSLDVTAPLLAEPLVKGYLVIPADVHSVGWYSGGGKLGAKTGTLLLAGHVNYVGQGWGAFGHLADLQRGATVFTTDSAGAVQAWRVTAVTAVLQTRLPQDIFDASGPRRLVLVTCGGTLEPDHLYNDNVVVYATPVAAR